MSEDIRFLTLRKFCFFYGFDRKAARKMIDTGQVRGFQAGNRWMVADPGWNMIKLLKNPMLAVEAMCMLRTAEVAEIMGVKVLTVKKWRQRKKINGQKFGCAWRYPISECRRLIEDRDKPRKSRARKGPCVRPAVVAYARKRLAEPVPEMEAPLHIKEEDLIPKPPPHEP